MARVEMEARTKEVPGGEADSLLNPSAPERSVLQYLKQSPLSTYIFAVSFALFFMASVFITIALILVFSSIQHTKSSAPAFSRSLKVLDKPLVILISSDGFRWGYQWKVPVPNINRLISNGTEAFPGMYPVYPSVTFPNHYSIATGLYPAWHGIVNNHFSDPNPANNESFSMGNLHAKWWLGEPIWQTVLKNGLEAAVYFWPGSQVIKPPWTCPPDSCPSYNGSVPFEVRVDTVLKYIDRPNRPSFIGLYFEEPDEEGHIYGPDAPQINSAISRVDSMIGRLLKGLEERKILEDVNIIMVGDHGMVGTCDKRLVFLEDLDPWVDIPKEWVDSYTPILGIRPTSNVDPAEVVKKIKAGLSSGKVQNGEHLQVYLKEDLPERLHYSSSDRIQPIIGIVDEGYKVEMKRSKRQECGGAHGYDNIAASMRTIFIGHGPRFAQGKKVDSFINVEIYNVITNILGIKGAQNNGTESFANSILLPKST